MLDPFLQYLLLEIRMAAALSCKMPSHSIKPGPVNADKSITSDAEKKNWPICIKAVCFLFWLLQAQYTCVDDEIGHGRSVSVTTYFQSNMKI